MTTNLFGETAPDPLEEPERRVDGRCAGGGECDGFGYIVMGADHSARRGREYARDRGVQDPDVVDTIGEQYRRRYTFLRPCRDCNGRLFIRWLGGHLEPEHDRAHCTDETCRETAPKRRH